MTVTKMVYLVPNYQFCCGLENGGGNPMLLSSAEEEYGIA